jgi:hypothetical protein
MLRLILVELIAVATAAPALADLTPPAAAKLPAS